MTKCDKWNPFTSCQASSSGSQMNSDIEGSNGGAKASWGLFLSGIKSLKLDHDLTKTGLSDNGLRGICGKILNFLQIISTRSRLNKFNQNVNAPGKLQRLWGQSAIFRLFSDEIMFWPKCNLLFCSNLKAIWSSLVQQYQEASAFEFDNNRLRLCAIFRLSFQRNKICFFFSEKTPTEK